MFRNPPTRVLLSDYEVFQTIHAICTQRLMTLSLAYCPPLSEEDESEGEAEFHQVSPSMSYTRSSSVQYPMSEGDRRACDVLKCYQDTKVYINSSTPDSDDLPAHSAGSHTALDTRSTNPSETYQSEDQDFLEIPDSQMSSTSQESSTDTTPPATIIFSPRSPEPTPRPRRMHRSVYYGNFPVLQVQVPEIYECIPGMVISDIMSGSGSMNLHGKSDPQPNSPEMYIPVFRSDEINMRIGVGTCLHSLPKKTVRRRS
ncbi:uncharacterized protein BHQ10_000521 [Talaromyces amestolkiae]|uniref:Uncharacterized protein n=1 Tax=Talaromyces amestolkiae TaxID=1196081 RepID=A0A364KLT1_TALAM|nr:uncharacterized protein BHQ10_000521 [Talaromyces amestolkiae]RAO64509.1 hypothetical protein BHQ10_000521 [Talaromyces amestolkiae]